jgi:peptidoglycan/LPS O-acetylase OafA/YrhL
MGLLRVMLAISVFMAHSPVTGNATFFIGFGGPSSVEIFFIISGIFIARILDKSYSSAKNFYVNRALRLYPIYFIVSGLILIRSVLFPELRDELFSYPFMALIIGAFANATFFGSDWLMFLRLNDGHLSFGNFNESDSPLWHMLLIPQAWSLGIEITFYLIAPLLCRVSTKKLIGFQALLFVVRGCAFVLGLNFDPWTYRFFPFELPLFILGILLYRVKTNAKDLPRIPWINLYFFLVVVYIGFSTATNLFLLPRGFQMIFLVILTGVVYLFGSDTEIDRKIGDFSYPIYMCHNLVISSYIGIVQNFSGRYPILDLFRGSTVSVGFTFIFVLLTSLLLLRLVHPIERIREIHRR